MNEKEDDDLATESSQSNPSTRMASAPLIYSEDGTIAWDQIWKIFCVLASEGGPPLRGEFLAAPANVDAASKEYYQVAAEIIRGIHLTSGLEASPAKPGWLAVKSQHAPQARWMSEQIVQENIQSYAEKDLFFVPIDSTYTLENEIKNIIAVVAKTAHYWHEHVLDEVKTVIAWEERIVGFWQSWNRSKKK
jgi:hypothetical protein